MCVCVSVCVCACWRVLAAHSGPAQCHPQAACLRACVRLRARRARMCVGERVCVRARMRAHVHAHVLLLSPPHNNNKNGWGGRGGLFPKSRLPWGRGGHLERREHGPSLGGRVQRHQTPLRLPPTTRDHPHTHIHLRVCVSVCVVWGGVEWCRCRGRPQCVSCVCACWVPCVVCACVRCAHASVHDYVCCVHVRACVRACVQVLC